LKSFLKIGSSRVLVEFVDLDEFSPLSEQEFGFVAFQIIVFLIEIRTEDIKQLIVFIILF